ncbi:MAG TPA: endonuclease/exonuclease/phosphatase family protein [Candidatus Binatus sp.]|nr:endonuclease/exonuclease/phosphatase family protein [Candidatus Binatus sp.]
MTLRVMTLNCWNVSEPFDERMRLVRAGIEALRPDAIGLQEIIVRRGGFDQAGVILEGLGYQRVFGPAFRWNETARLLPSDHPDGDAFGNTIASRWPISRTAVHALPGAETDERRSVLAALIETPAGTLPFFTTHLNWKPHDGPVRERQVAAVAEVVREMAREGRLPPILVGDLNAEPDSTEIRFLCGLASIDGRTIHLEDAWRRGGDRGPGFTWDNRNRFAAYSAERDRRIDYILVGPPDRNGRGAIASAQVAFTEPAGDVFASDHFGVVADVRL